MEVVNAFDDADCRIRVDQATQQASVIDVIRMVTGAASKDAAITFRRLGGGMAARCRVAQINGRGKETPLANAQTLVEIIWVLPGKAAAEFRRNSAQYICRILGADLRLAREIEERHQKTSQPMKDFFMSQATTPACKRSRVTIGFIELEVPNDDDTAAVKQLLQGRIDQALKRESEEAALEFEARKALNQRELEATSERRMVLATREIEEESERRLVLMRESNNNALALSRESHKGALHQLAIKNSELVSERTKAVNKVLNTLKACELMHPSLMTAAIGSIANMAAAAAGAGETFNHEAKEPSHIEDFSALTHNLFKMTLDLSHLAAIGKLVATEFRKRYAGKHPEKIIKQVNGSMRPINVYEQKDREWIEGIIKEYVNNIPVIKKRPNPKNRKQSVNDAMED